MLTKQHRSSALQVRKHRQASHDARCRPVLETVAATSQPWLSVALRRLVEAGIPAPGGKDWHRKAVWLIARRLGITLGTGRAFGDFPRCARCHRQMGRVYPDTFCQSCHAWQRKVKVDGDIRRAELAEARERLRFNQEQEIGVLGWKRWHLDSLDTRRARAALHTAQTWDVIAAYRRLGYGWREVAKLLNCSGLVGPRGGVWHPNTVRRVYAQGLRRQEGTADD